MHMFWLFLEQGRVAHLTWLLFLFSLLDRRVKMIEGWQSTKQSGIRTAACFLNLFLLALEFRAWTDFSKAESWAWHLFLFCSDSISITLILVPANFFIRNYKNNPHWFYSQAICLVRWTLMKGPPDSSVGRKTGFATYTSSLTAGGLLFWNGPLASPSLQIAWVRIASG